jgi:drug/metabolite transporter (DMT)-like permease
MEKSPIQQSSGPLAVVGAATLWSLDGFLRRSLYSLPAPVIVFWEHVLGGLVALVLVARSFGEFRRLTRSQWWAIGAVSLLSGALGTIFYTRALALVTFIPFSVVVLLQQLQPLFTIGLAKVVLRERIDSKFFALVVVALAAAYGVSFPTLSVNTATGAGTAVAALLAIGAAASWGSSTVLSKLALSGTSSLHVTAARFWLTPVFAFLVAIVTGSVGRRLMD